MPYRIKKSKHGFYVENEDTGKKYSKHPIPLSNAKKQMAVLYLKTKDIMKK